MPFLTFFRTRVLTHCFRFGAARGPPRETKTRPKVNKVNKKNTKTLSELLLLSSFVVSTRFLMIFDVFHAFDLQKTFIFAGIHSVFSTSAKTHCFACRVRIWTAFCLFWIRFAAQNAHKLPPRRERRGLRKA